MRFHKSAGAGCAILLFCAAALAQPSDDKTGIEQVLHDQETAWNRGDIDAFMHGYKDSPDTTFIGKTLRRGYRPILENYKTRYATNEAMGKLDYSELTVRMLGNNYAVVTGKYHLARTEGGGGEASGIFSLVFEHESDGWRIILDHTS
ncbi:MAG: nuclear transport factor 2 family protein [Silvibacterium sp.]